MADIGYMIWNVVLIIALVIIFAAIYSIVTGGLSVTSSQINISGTIT